MSIIIVLLMEFAYHYCFDCIYWSMFWLVFLSVSPPSPGRIVDNIFGHYWLKCWNCRTAMVWLVDFSLTVVLIGGFFTHCWLDWWVFHSLLSWLVDFSLTVVLIGGFFTHCCLDWCSSRSFLFLFMKYLIIALFLLFFFLSFFCLFFVVVELTMVAVSIHWIVYHYCLNCWIVGYSCYNWWNSIITCI